MRKFVPYIGIIFMIIGVVWLGDIMQEYQTPVNATKVFEVAKLKEEIQSLKNQRLTVTPTPIPVQTKIPLKKENVISAINNNLSGDLKDKGIFFYYAGTMYNVNPMLLASIAIHESANGTSLATIRNKNIAGIMANSYKGVLKKYEDIDLCIAEMARLLKTNYIDLGLKDITSIGNKYCPVGANNDPTDLNKHWIPAVTKNYIKILKEAERGN